MKGTPKEMAAAPGGAEELVVRRAWVERGRRDGHGGMKEEGVARHRRKHTIFQK